MYFLLADYFNYTPKEISEMTFYQQNMLVNKGHQEHGGVGTLKFDTMEELAEWRLANGMVPNG